MEILFPDNKLRALCEQERLAVKTLGQACARKLRGRLSDLVAAAHVRELLTGRPHPLKGEWHGRFSLNLHGGFRLVFEPAHDPVPTLDHGGIDWAQVTRITIVFIGDYHD